MQIAKQSKNIIFIDDPNLAPYIGAADVMISDVSSAFMEFMALNKPVILYNNPNIKNYHGYDKNNIEYKWRNLGNSISSFNELIPLLKRILTQGDSKSNLRKKYSELLFADLSGNASQNVWSQTLKLFVHNNNNIEIKVLSVVINLNADNLLFYRKLIYLLQFNSVMPLELVVVQQYDKSINSYIDNLKKFNEFINIKQVFVQSNLDPFIEGIKSSTGDYIVIIREDVIIYKNFDYIIHKTFQLNPEIFFFTGITNTNSLEINYSKFLTNTKKYSNDRLAYEFIYKFQCTNITKLKNIFEPPPLIVLNKETILKHTQNTFHETFTSLVSDGKIFISPSLYYDSFSDSDLKNIYSAWTNRLFLNNTHKIKHLNSLVKNIFLSDVYEEILDTQIKVKASEEDITSSAFTSSTYRFYDERLKNKAVSYLPKDNHISKYFNYDLQIINSFYGKTSKKDKQCIKVLFYFFKNVHLPILIPIYQKLKSNYKNIEIAFGYISHSPEIRAGFLPHELEILASFGEDMYLLPKEFNPHITFIADAVYPWVQNCGLLVNVGHGVLSKGQYYTDTGLARREEQSDLVCVPGEFHKKIMTKIISTPVVDTGMAKLDAVFSGRITRDSMLRKYNIKNGYKFILFAPTFNDELSALPYIGESIIKVIPDNKTFLLVKLHGSTKQSYKDLFRNLYKKDARVIYIDELDITPFLALADIMISDVSSAMMEFAALDKPVILYNNPDTKKYVNYNPADIEYKWRDIGIQVSNLEEMIEAVRKSFENPLEYSQKRCYYSRQLFSNIAKGDASEKIISSALSLYKKYENMFKDKYKY